MKKLLTIHEKDVYPEAEDKKIDYTLREAARAILFDSEQKIALLHVTRFGYYKLPGGGIDEGESVKEALRRECREEVGCEIKIENEIGEIEEFREQWKIRQVSYCFKANVVGEKGEPKFEQGEIDEGFELVWVTLDEAKELIRNSKPDSASYDSVFIVKRDLAFLDNYT